jgi:hypothetical protein
VFLNLTEFLQIQMLLKIETIAAVITTWHRGLQPLLTMLITDDMEERLMFMLMIDEIQFQTDTTKGHCINKWEDVSECLQHKLHMEGRRKPRMDKFSSVEILLLISLHIIKNLDGGIALFQINFARSSFWVEGEINW